MPLSPNGQIKPHLIWQILPITTPAPTTMDNSVATIVAVADGHQEVSEATKGVGVETTEPNRRSHSGQDGSPLTHI